MGQCSHRNCRCLRVSLVDSQGAKIRKGRTYLRPATGTLESPHEDTFDAPPGGRGSKCHFMCPEISKVSLRTAAEATRNGCLGYWFSVMGSWVRVARLRSEELRRDKFVARPEMPRRAARCKPLLRTGTKARSLAQADVELGKPAVDGGARWSRVRACQPASSLSAKRKLPSGPSPAPPR